MADTLESGMRRVPVGTTNLDTGRRFSMGWFPNLRGGVGGRMMALFMPNDVEKSFSREILGGVSVRK